MIRRGSPGQAAPALASGRGASRLTVPGGVRVQPQAAGHDVAGDIGQPQIITVSIGAQPSERIRDANPELLGEHPGGPVDLGPAQRQVRGLATGAGQCREVASHLVLGVEQQHGGGIGEDQRIAELEGGQRAWPLPVKPSTPARIAPICSGNAKIAAAPA